MIANAVPGASSRGPEPFFMEDFDERPTESTETPEVISPIFTIEELQAARTAAWSEGHEAALAEASLKTREQMSTLARSIAQQIGDLQETARSLADTQARALAELLLDVLAGLFPTLCTQFGENEARRLARPILEGLDHEPEVTLRADPSLAEFLQEELSMIAPDKISRVKIIPNNAFVRGDIRISWSNGVAERDPTSLWNRISSVLAGFGLRCPEMRTEDQHAA